MLQLPEEREVKPPAVSNATTIPAPAETSNHSHSVIHVEDREREEAFQAPARRIFQDIRETRSVTFDHDEDKYKRRPTSEVVRRWWKNALGSQPQGRNTSSIAKRYCMLAILVVITLGVMLLLMSKLGRYYTENDPSLDLKFEPNVRVHDQDIKSM